MVLDLLAMEQWWTPRDAGWVGGGIGVLGGVFGSVLGCCGYLVQQGRAKGFVLGGLWLMTALGAVALVGGVAALAASQPYHVYYPLLLAGGLFLVMGVMVGVSVRRRYRAAEARKLDAAQIRAG